MARKTVREDRVSFNSCISACQAAEWPLALRLAELSAAKGPLLVDDFNAPRGGGVSGYMNRKAGPHVWKSSYFDA